MKRTVAMLLASFMCLGLVGCGEDLPDPTIYTSAPTTETTVPVETTTEAVTTTATETEVTTQPETTEAQFIQAPMVAVSVPVITEYSYQTEDVPLFSYSYQYMTLIQPDQAVADRIVLDFQQRQDQYNGDAEDYARQAAAAYDGSEFWTPYLFSTLYSPTRVDQAVLSLTGTYSTWRGGVHPEHHCLCANYNMLTGDVLTLGSILYHDNQVPVLAELIIEAIDAIKDEKSVMDGFDVTIRNRLESNVNFDEQWYFSTDGLCFCFSPYEIAPYASGVVTVTIPYEKLVGVIDDSFFPPEQPTPAGEITATRFQDTDHSKLTQIAEVILDREGERVFLYTDGKVDNVTLELGQWDPSGQIFLPTCKVFATQSLAPGDAVMVQTDIPDVMPTLLLSYDSGEETVTRFITQSGKDGTILLVGP